MVHSSPTLPPLDTVEAFTRTAKTGSFSAAAQSLGLTHGAVSRQVSRLERWMGVRLFDRTARGVVLTPEGSRFLARAEGALALLAGTHDRWAPRQGPAVVRLSITPSLTSLWLFPRLAAIERPDLHLDLRLEHRLAEFSDGLDLAIRCGRGPWAGVRSIRLWTEDVFPIASPGLAATLGTDPPPAALLDHPILNDSNTEGWRLWFSEAGIDYVPRARDRRFEDYNMVLDACANGLGLALARPPLSDRTLASGRVAALDRRTVRYHVAFHMIRPSEPLRPAAAEVARRILSEAGVGASEREAFVAPSARTRS